MLLLITRAPAADASHPFQGSGQYGNINYLYRNLEVPTGSGILTYSLCGTPYGNPPQEWRNGIERWDDAIARWQFNEASQCSSAHTRVKWDTAGDICDNDDDPGEVNLAWACWSKGDNTSAHGSHVDLGFHATRPPRVIIDYKDWNAFTNQAWRDYIPAHEWGHNMSHADHSGTSDCGQNTLMLNYVGASIPPNPCNTSPTTNDLNSVNCNVYKLCAGVRVASGDVDSDGCDEIITSAGPGPMSYVRVWDALVGNCITSTSGIFVRAQFLAYVDGFEGGVYVAAGNIDTSTAADEVITGAGPGGGPHVKVWRCCTVPPVEVRNWNAY